MAENLEKTVRGICDLYAGDHTRMMDIVREVQQCFGQVSGEAMDIIADAVDSHRVEVESVVSISSNCFTLAITFSRTAPWHSDGFMTQATDLNPAV